MKKIIFCFVFMIMIFSFSSCVKKVDQESCNHVWDDGVELSSGSGAYTMKYTCKTCGKTDEQIITIIPEKKFLTVREGIDNLEKLKKYSMEFSLTQIYENNKSEEMISMSMKNDGEKQKIKISIMGEVFNFYTVTESNKETNEIVTYIIFDTKLISPSLNGYVKVSAAEIIELFFGVAPENPDISDDSEIDEIEMTGKKVIDFFMGLKDEYFKLNEDEWYVFNQKGKDEFEKVINDFEDVIAGTVSTPYKFDLDLDLKVKTNKEYITDINFDLIGNNVDTNDTEIMRFICSFDDFDEVSVTVPTNVMTLEELMEYLQNQEVSNI